jgi:hypothetical protein
MMDKFPAFLKGSIALKFMRMIDNEDHNRLTTDFDLSLTKDLSDSQIKEFLKRELYEFDKTIIMKQTRESSEKSTSSFDFIDNSDDYYKKNIDDSLITNYSERLLFSADIERYEDNKKYVTINLDGLDIPISPIIKQTADKTSAISGRKVFRRAKDVSDLYEILQKYDIDYAELTPLLKLDEKMFEPFIRDNKEAEKAYDKLTGIIGDKPSFDDVYGIIISFIHPYLVEDFGLDDIIWNHEDQVIWLKSFYLDYYHRKGRI